MKIALEEYLRETFMDFESFLQKSSPSIPSFHPYYEKALWEMVGNGGKRFRAKLFLSVVCAYFFPKKQKLPHKFFIPALALEVMHAYSLIHDDLPAMDNADLRRGCPTLHKKYDEAGAILIGDGLNTYSFLLLTQNSFRPKIQTALIRCLAGNAGVSGMVLGQALDCFFDGQKLPLEKLKVIHRNKTAKLIAASLQMGAISLQQSKKEQKQLYKVGLDLGLLFQIRDDLIDATKSTQEAGKDTHKDGDKNSYVTLLGIKQTQSIAEKLEKKIFKELDKCPKSLYNALLEVLQYYLSA